MFGMNIVKLNIRWSLNFMFMIISKIRFVTDGMLMEVRVDNRERLALADKVQKDIQKRTLNYRLIRRREKIEREFEKMFQNK